MKVLSAAALVFVSMIAMAQVAAPSQPATASPAMPAVNTAALGALLSQVEQTAHAATLDLARMRIEKWKGKGDVKEQLQANSESLQRNMQAALPALVQGVRAQPTSLAAQFKLYRNLEALNDVFNGLTTAAGSMAPKDDYEVLTQHAAAFDQTRRELASRLETATAAADSEIALLRGRVNQAQQGAAGSTEGGPKRIVVDDNEPKKRPRRKPVPKPPQ